MMDLVKPYRQWLIEVHGFKTDEIPVEGKAYAKPAHGIPLTWPTRCCSSPTAVELGSLKLNSCWVRAQQLLSLCSTTVELVQKLLIFSLCHAKLKSAEKSKRMDRSGMTQLLHSWFWIFPLTSVWHGRVKKSTIFGRAQQLLSTNSTVVELELNNCWVLATQVQQPLGSNNNG